MRETDPNQLCYTVPLSTVNRTMICVIVVVLVTMLNPGRATAGIVVEQRITISAPGEPSLVRNLTLMLQGDKEKFQSNDRASIVIDATKRMATMLDNVNKTFRESPSGSVIGTILDPNHLLYTAFKSTDQTRERLGYKCRDYTGVTYDGPTFTATTTCFSTDTAGSDDFSHFIRLIIGRYGRAISVPAGVPLIIESTRKGNPAFSPPDISAKEAVRFKNIIAKIPPQVTRVEVTKITSEKLSPDVFNIPAGYSRSGPEPH
ncbi:MAG: hypothetical protein JO189_05660 [Deltaproteobacteria bacterium]|nr:hypothetical protein [Deltaproteobacteria bacterium]